MTIVVYNIFFLSINHLLKYFVLKYNVYLGNEY